MEIDPELERDLRERLLRVIDAHYRPFLDWVKGPDLDDLAKRYHLYRIGGPLRGPQPAARPAHLLALQPEPKADDPSAE